MASMITRKREIVQDPPLARFLFADTRAAWIWLVVRLWVSYKWIDASSHKLGNPAWTQTGDAVKGFWTNAVMIPETGKPMIAFDWYRNFLQMLLDAEAYRWMAPIIAYSEMLIGIALLLGIFTGIAAFFGAFMNWNFMMAGTTSTNPVLFVLAIGLLLAWKVSGYFGVDRYLLPLLGTPWQSRPLKEDEAKPSLSPAPSQA